jgi:hypothetical protein
MEAAGFDPHVIRADGQQGNIVMSRIVRLHGTHLSRALRGHRDRSAGDNRPGFIDDVPGEASSGLTV